MTPKCVTIQIKAIEQYFHVLMFITLYRAFLSFTSVDKTVVCDHSNESYGTVLSCGTIYYVVQGVSKRYFHVILFIMLHFVKLHLLALRMKRYRVALLSSELKHSTVSCSF